MELGIIVAGFVLIALMVKNLHDQSLDELNDLKEMQLHVIEKIADDISNDD